MIGHCPEKKNNKLYHIIKSRKPNKHSDNKHFLIPPKKIHKIQEFQLKIPVYALKK